MTVVSGQELLHLKRIHLKWCPHRSPSLGLKLKTEHTRVYSFLFGGNIWSVQIMIFVTTFKNTSDMVCSCLSVFTPVPLGRFPCSLFHQSWRLQELQMFKGIKGSSCLWTLFYFFWLSIYYSSLLLIYKHFGFSSNMSFEHLSLCEGTVSEGLKYSCITRAHSSKDNNSQKLESCGSHRTTCKHLSRWTGRCLLQATQAVWSFSEKFVCIRLF